MENIRISWNEVRQLASEMREVNQEMIDTLEVTHRKMQSLATIWDSKGSMMIRERFEHFTGRFIEEKAIIDEYVQFLDRTATSYESLETTISQNVSNFE